MSLLLGSIFLGNSNFLIYITALNINTDVFNDLNLFPSDAVNVLVSLRAAVLHSLTAVPRQDKELRLYTKQLKYFLTCPTKFLSL